MVNDDIVKYLRLSRTRFNRHAEAADEIERQRELLRLFWKESQCIECWELDSEVDEFGNSEINHDPNNCEVAKVQRQYVAMFRDDDYMMAEDDD